MKSVDVKEGSAPTVHFSTQKSNLAYSRQKLIWGFTLKVLDFLLRSYLHTPKGAGVREKYVEVNFQVWTKLRQKDLRQPPIFYQNYLKGECLIVHGFQPTTATEYFQISALFAMGLQRCASGCWQWFGVTDIQPLHLLESLIGVCMCASLDGLLSHR